MQCLCRWIPGTMDQVRVTSGDLTAQFSLGEVVIVLGSKAVNDLYLKGRADVSLTQPLAWPLSRKHDQRYLRSVLPA